MLLAADRPADALAEFEAVHKVEPTACARSPAPPGPRCSRATSPRPSATTPAGRRAHGLGRPSRPEIEAARAFVASNVPRESRRRGRPAPGLAPCRYVQRNSCAQAPPSPPGRSKWWRRPRDLRGPAAARRRRPRGGGVVRPGSVGREQLKGGAVDSSSGNLNLLVLRVTRLTSLQWVSHGRRPWIATAELRALLIVVVQRATFTCRVSALQNCCAAYIDGAKLIYRVVAKTVFAAFRLSSRDLFIDKYTAEKMTLLFMTAFLRVSLEMAAFRNEFRAIELLIVNCKTIILHFFYLNYDSQELVQLLKSQKDRHLCYLC